MAVHPEEKLIGPTRMLCLYGYHGSAAILRRQIAPLVAVLPAHVELVFVDAPSLSSGDLGWWHEGFRGWERTRDSLLLAERFAHPLILEHRGGHVIPADPAVTTRIVDFGDATLSSGRRSAGCRRTVAGPGVGRRLAQRERSGDTADRRRAQRRIASRLPHGTRARRARRAGPGLPTAGPWQRCGVAGHWQTDPRRPGRGRSLRPARAVPEAAGGYGARRHSVGEPHSPLTRAAAMMRHSPD